VAKPSTENHQMSRKAKRIFNSIPHLPVGEMLSVIKLEKSELMKS
jgi:hypothetical protein